MTKHMSEDKVQELIKSDELVQERIKELLDLNGEVEFIPEDSYINGITADFTVLQNNKIMAIIECKAGNINLTDYVRGIGQLFQYEYCFEKKVPHNSYEYSEDFKIIYFYPDSVINKSYNIAKFKYPKTSTIYILKERTKEIQEIPKNILKKIDEEEDNGLIMISPYYVRDIRIFEYYMLMRYSFLQETMGIKKFKRDGIFIENFFKKTETINKKSIIKNGWITLSNCGLIKKGNLLTEAGKRLVVLDYEEFAVEMYHNFFEPYFNEILKCFGDEKIINLTLSGWEELIRKNNDNRDVCFLTDTKDTQSMSSWLNIMQDDFGIIEFEKNKIKKGVKLIYDPRTLNDDALMEKVKNNSVGHKYIQNFQRLIVMSIYTHEYLISESIPCDDLNEDLNES